MALAPTYSDTGVVPVVKSYARIPQVMEVPYLIQSQLQSFEWFKTDGLRDVFREVSPIEDYTGNKYQLSFMSHSFSPPKYTPEQCKEREVTYSASLSVRCSLVLKETGEIKETDVYMGDIPIMTNNATFVINGAERVVVSQLVRSPGVYFVVQKDLSSDRDLFGQAHPLSRCMAGV
jgi:DNA-directed RNA polymerase subunit beta